MSTPVNGVPGRDTLGGSRPADGKAGMKDDTKKLPLKSLLDFSGQRPMTPDETRMFLSCCIASMRSEALADDAAQKILPYAIIRGRLEGAKVDIDPWLQMLCASFSSTPGRAVLWAYTLAELCHRKDGGRVMVSDFAEFFPMGVPTEEALDKCWDAQKGDGPLGNLMDKKESWFPAP